MFSLPFICEEPEVWRSAHLDSSACLDQEARCFPQWVCLQPGDPSSEPSLQAESFIWWEQISSVGHISALLLNTISFLVQWSPCLRLLQELLGRLDIRLSVRKQ